MIKRKQRFSLRKNKIGTASVLLGLTIVGGVSLNSTDAYAENVQNKSGHECCVKTENTLITEEKVNKARENFDKIKVDFENQKKLVEEKNKDYTNKAEEFEAKKKDLELAKKIKEEANPQNIKNTEEKIKSLDNTKLILEKKIEGSKSSVLNVEKEIENQEKVVDLSKENTKIKQNLVDVVKEKVDNTNMVKVSMDMNSDLGTLMSASKTLMDNTKANQAVSETIQATMTQLTNDVNTLEKDGKSLSERVSELKKIMSSEYGSNEEFLKNFSTVLSNTRTGNTKNEAVYEYLSNPVDASKIGNVVSAATNSSSQTNRQDERSGLLIILISYLVSLVVVYLFQHADKEELQRLISLKDRLSWRNSSGPMFFLSVISVAAGSIIAIISGVKLAFSVSQLSWFVVLLVLVSLIMTYGLNILMDKLKSLGFLISISLLLLYIISATQLFDEYYVNSAPILTALSPLTYLEGAVKLFINQQNGVVQSVMVIVVLTIALGLGNTFLYRQVKDSK